MCENGGIIEIEVGKTGRGFDLIEFVDRYDCKCSLQESSLATEAAIWFGCNDADPQIMASDAKRLGISTNADSGWIPYHIPSEVSLTTRMHLTQDQVKALLPYLERFAKTGSLI